MDAKTRLLNQKQAAERLGVSRLTIQRLVNKGLLRCTLIGEKIYRFTQEDVEAMIKVVNDNKLEGGSSSCKA